MGTVGGFRSLRNAQTALCVKNEVLMWKCLHAMLTKLIAAYPTTLQQDCEALEDHNKCPLFSNRRNAMIQMRGEKEVLHFYLDFAEVALDVLQTWPVEHVVTPEFGDKLEHIRQTKHFLVYNYCRHVAHRLLLEEKRKNELRARNVNLALPTVV